MKHSRNSKKKFYHSALISASLWVNTNIDEKKFKNYFEVLQKAERDHELNFFKAFES